MVKTIYKSEVTNDYDNVHALIDISSGPSNKDKGNLLKLLVILG